MFKVEIKFKDDLKDVDDYTAAVDEIFALWKTRCIESRKGYRLYGDNGDPKDIGRLYGAVGDVSDYDWIVAGIDDATFDNGYRCIPGNLMTSFFERA